MKQDDGSYRFGLWPAQSGPSKWKAGKPVEIEGKKFWMDIYPNKHFEPGGNKPEFNLVFKPAEDRPQQGGNNPNANSGGYDPNSIPF